MEDGQEQKLGNFAKHLVKVFQPFEGHITPDEEDQITAQLGSPFQLSPPIQCFSPGEIIETIKDNLNPKKAPGYDLITGRLLKEITRKVIMLLTAMFNAVIRTGFYPIQCKIAKIMMILKPGKPTQEVTSYRPISLLPIVSKLFEKVLLTKLKPILEKKRIIPDQQFGFRGQHATIEQVHRVADKIRKYLVVKRYCSAAFLDISKAFDKVWHKGLLIKLKDSSNLSSGMYCRVK
jgi:hypothetical protein